jgi:hypothetical protein
MVIACSDYLVAILVLGMMGLGALALLYEFLVKLEERWDRALEAQRYRNRCAEPSVILSEPTIGQISRSNTLDLS